MLLKEQTGLVVCYFVVYKPKIGPKTVKITVFSIFGYPTDKKIKN